jgi:hypothetical protein
MTQPFNALTFSADLAESYASTRLAAKMYAKQMERDNLTPLDMANWLAHMFNATDKMTLVSLAVMYTLEQITEARAEGITGDMLVEELNLDN